jgi:hypothetical protein
MGMKMLYIFTMHSRMVITCTLLWSKSWKTYKMLTKSVEISFLSSRSVGNTHDVRFCMILNYA